MKFPNLLWALRERRIAQFEMAAKVGISESKLSRAMNGRVLLSAEEQSRIGDALGYPVPWLFREKRPPQARTRWGARRLRVT
jgi:transcriptional regulator with XRE-family HTH domain